MSKKIVENDIMDSFKNKDLGKIEIDASGDYEFFKKQIQESNGGKPVKTIFEETKDELMDFSDFQKKIKSDFEDIYLTHEDVELTPEGDYEIDLMNLSKRKAPPVKSIVEETVKLMRLDSEIIDKAGITKEEAEKQIIDRLQSPAGKSHESSYDPEILKELLQDGLELPNGLKPTSGVKLNEEKSKKRKI